MHIFCAYTLFIHLEENKLIILVQIPKTTYVDIYLTRTSIVCVNYVGGNDVIIAAGNLSVLYFVSVFLE